MNAEQQALIELLGLLLSEPRSGLLIALLCLAAWLDWRTRRIPNLLIAAGIALGLAVNSLYPVGPDAALPGALAGLACGLLLFLPFYLLRAMGAADVKLMAMSGAFLGFPGTLHAVLATLLAGGLLALLYALSRGALRPLLHNVSSLLHGAWLSIEFGQRPALGLDQSAASVGKLPYGLAIAGGTISYLVLRQLGLL